MSIFHHAEMFLEFDVLFWPTWRPVSSGIWPHTNFSGCLKCISQLDFEWRVARVAATIGLISQSRIRPPPPDGHGPEKNAN